MRRAAAFITAAVIVCMIFSSCMREPYVAPPQRTMEDFARELYVINTLAESVSVINADTGDVYPDVFTTGMWTNHCFFYGGNIYLVNSGDNNIEVYDESTFEYQGEIYLGAGSNPWMIIHKPGTDTAFVPCFASGDMAEIDLASLSVEQRIPLGRGPEGGAYQDGKIYVGNTAWNYSTFAYEEGTVSVVNADTGELITTVSVETNPQSIIAFPAMDEVHVICSGKNGGPDADDGSIVVIDTLTDTVTHTIAIGGSPSGDAGSVDGLTGMVYLTGVGGILSYHSGSKTVVNSSADYLLAGADPEGDLYSGLAVDEDSRRMYVCFFTGDSIIEIDLDDYSVVKEISGSDGPQSIYLFTE